MTDDEAPKPPVAQDRQRHGAVDAHVPVVLQVDGRQASQPCEGEVERLARAPLRNAAQGHGLVVATGHPAQRAAGIKVAGLLRDVRGREVQTPERLFPILHLVLGDRFAVPALVEAVDEDALVAGDRADAGDRDAGQRLDIASRCAQAADHPLQRAGGRQRLLALALARPLKLDEDHAVVEVRGRVEAEAAADGDQIGLPRYVRGQVPGDHPGR